MTKKFLICCAVCFILAVSAQAQTNPASLKKKNPPEAVAVAAAKASQSNSTDQALQRAANEQLKLTREQATAADQQATAANRQVWAAWVQAFISFATVAATLLLLNLTRSQIKEMVNQRTELQAQRSAMELQRSEMEKDRQEAIKARALSLMPVLMCSINDDYSNRADHLENNGGTQYLKVSTVKLQNAGNATALKTHVTIEQIDGPQFFQVVNQKPNWHTVNVGDVPEYKFQILPAFSDYAKLTQKTNVYHIQAVIEYVNAYNQKFETRTQFTLKPYIEFIAPPGDRVQITASIWQKEGEDFTIKDW